jgi:hypothetical protein
MKSRRPRKFNRWLAAGAVVLVALGSSLVVQGSAGANVPIAHYPAIRLWNRYEVATLALPSHVPCPRSQPDCKWKLTVYETVASAHTIVGSVVGDAGTLTVTYPLYFCGVLIAEAFVGPKPYILQREIQQSADTGGACGAGTGANVTTVGSTIAPTVPVVHAVTVHSSPQGPSVVVAAAAAHPTASTVYLRGVRYRVLAFTGTDVRPLVFIGAALVLLGFYIITTLEQRRRAMRRMAHAVRTSEVPGHATRVTRWFLGD